MSESLFSFDLTKFEQLIESSIQKSFEKYFAAKEEKPVIKQPEYFTRKEALHFLKISSPTLYRMSRKGGLLKPIYIGQRVLYDKEELNSVLQNLKKSQE